MPDSDPHIFSAEVFAERITVLEERQRQLQRELAKVDQELEWSRKGLEIYGEGGSDSDSTDAEPSPEDGKATELVPSNEVLRSKGTRPTLRQAILRCMLDRRPVNGREVAWPVPMVISELESRGWSPSGKNAENMVRHMLGDMLKKGQLDRPSYGKYAVAPTMRAQELDAGRSE